MLKKTYTFLLALAFFHYIFNYIFHVPIGFLFIAFVLLIDLLPGQEASSFIRLDNGRIIKTALLYICLLLISSLAGILIGNLEYDRYFVNRYLVGASQKLRSGFLSSVPDYIPGYGKWSQPLLGLEYTIVFPILLIANSLALRKIQLTFSELIRSILPLLLLNTFVVIMEKLLPIIHAGMMTLARYGEGTYFFSFRALGLGLNVYINAFLNTLLFIIAFSRLLQYRKISALLLSVYSIVILLVSGTRVGMLAAGIAAVVLIWNYFDAFRELVLKNIIFVFFLLIGSIYFILQNEELIKILNTFATMNDEKGSTQLHTFLFYNALDILFSFPFGIGIGKADFGAFADNNWINTESHMMSLAIGTGFPGVILFSLLNIQIYASNFRKVFKSRVMKTLCISIFIISWINMQFYQSLLPVIILAVLLSFTFLEERGNDVLPSDCPI